MPQPLHFGKRVIQRWHEHECLRWGAALSYYSALSLAPLLILVLFFAGLFFDSADIERRMDQQVHEVVGADGAEAVKLVLRNAARPTEGGIATIISLGVLLIGASAVFAELQKALNHIWGVQTDPAVGWKAVIVTRLISVGIVLALGFLMLVSLVLSAMAAAIADSLGGGVAAQVLNIALSLGLTTVLMALIFKVLPDAETRWRDVWLGAAVTALLITLGKFLIGLYLGKASVGSAYGAAGSVIVLLVWVYYTTQTLFLGAEFTVLWAETYGAGVAPDERGVWADESSTIRIHDGKRSPRQAHTSGPQRRRLK